MVPEQLGLVWDINLLIMIIPYCDVVLFIHDICHTTKLIESLWSNIF